MKRVDLNCDMGESFGPYTIGSDEQLMPYITSANIACGAHAGDPNVMSKTIELAKHHNVAVGAHPGFPDVAGFGRRMIDYTTDEIYRMVVYQAGALKAFCDVHEVTMQHVKPHGALYNLAGRNESVADAIAHAVHDLDAQLVLYGLAGSELLRAGKELGLCIASEVFADRTYQSDGSLTPRSEPNALMKEVDAAVRQMEHMVSNGVVEAVDGTNIAIKADTICLHGDGDHAQLFAKALRDKLEKM